MSIEFALPDLGENIESGDVVNVLVQVGDQLVEDQPVIELETDKAVSRKFLMRSRSRRESWWFETRVWIHSDCRKFAPLPLNFGIERSVPHLGCSDDLED